jgi:hypothetical protein
MKQDLLVSVGGVSTRGMTLKAIGKVLKETARPMELVFERHRRWARGENGLPALDHRMLRSVFSSHDKTGSASLDADEFFAFMEEIHKIRTSIEGKDLLRDFSSMKEHAQNLIDAHDDNDDGRIDFAELEAWIDKGLRMGAEERVAYAKRGGYCPDAMRFVEDVAIALHAADQTKDLAASAKSVPAADNTDAGSAWGMPDAGPEEVDCKDGTTPGMARLIMDQPGEKEQAKAAGKDLAKKERVLKMNKEEIAEKEGAKKEKAAQEHADVEMMVPTKQAAVEQATKEKAATDQAAKEQAANVLQETSVKPKNAKENTTGPTKHYRNAGGPARRAHLQHSALRKATAKQVTRKLARKAKKDQHAYDVETQRYMRAQRKIAAERNARIVADNKVMRRKLRARDQARKHYLHKNKGPVPILTDQGTFDSRIMRKLAEGRPVKENNAHVGVLAGLGSSPSLKSIHYKYTEDRAHTAEMEMVRMLETLKRKKQKGVRSKEDLQEEDGTVNDGEAGTRPTADDQDLLLQHFWRVVKDFCLSLDNAMEIFVRSFANVMGFSLETVTAWCPKVMIRLFHSRKSKRVLLRQIQAMDEDSDLQDELNWAKHDMISWLLARQELEKARALEEQDVSGAAPGRDLLRRGSEKISADSVIATQEGMPACVKRLPFEVASEQRMGRVHWNSSATRPETPFFAEEWSPIEATRLTDRHVPSFPMVTNSVVHGQVPKRTTHQTTSAKHMHAHGHYTDYEKPEKKAPRPPRDRRSLEARKKSLNAKRREGWKDITHRPM